MHHPDHHAPPTIEDAIAATEKLVRQRKLLALAATPAVYPDEVHAPRTHIAIWTGDHWRQAMPGEDPYSCWRPASRVEE